MNKAIKEAVLKKIESYDKIIIARHIRPDGDAVGSTKGLQRILQLTYPEKHIYVINDDYAQHVAFLGGEEPQMEDAFYQDALGIVLDTGTFDRISNKKMNLVKELIKIDHHIVEVPYGDLVWVEDTRSSTCEMIVDFYDTFSSTLKMDKDVAFYLYTGMVTDSGRFRFTSTTSETFRLASILMQYPFDTEKMYANLYLEDFQSLEAKSFFYKKIHLTENGVAYIYVTKAIQEKLGLTQEKSSTVVDYMDSIAGSMVWLAFIDAPGNKIRVRLRSRFLEIQKLATRYHGGGHDKASGATVYSKKEMNALIKEADELLKAFKETHPDCL